MAAKFLPSAVLGNSRLLVTLAGSGEIQRLFWPHVDGPQHVERLLVGIGVPGEPVIWQDDPSWQCEQAYEPDQNVLVTVARHPRGLAVRTVEAAVPDLDILVRQVTVTNAGRERLPVRYALYQWLRVDENPLHNTALYDEGSDSLVHYRRDVFVALGADRPLAAAGVGPSEAVLAAATAQDLAGTALILHGDVAAAGLWDLGTLAPGESAGLALFWALGSNIGQVRELLAAARREGAEKLLAETRRYWAGWLRRARPLAVPGDGGEAAAPAPGRTALPGLAAEPAAAPARPALPGLPVEPAAPGQVAELYRRSLLVFKLMTDAGTGAVIAAPECDPAYRYCGGYGFCWGRDAAYVTVAMDRAGLHDLAGAFYRWALGTQEPEGWWMHRHHTTGQWGSSWGLIQTDETGSILYGMAVHARLHGGAAFAREVWPAVRRAAAWLLRNLDPETGLPRPAVDLWEERVGVHTYSAAAAAAGLRAAAELAGLAGEEAAGDQYRRAAEALRSAIWRECVRDGVFLRGRYLQIAKDAYLALRAAGEPVRERPGVLGRTLWERVWDPVMDASLLGLAYPFAVADPGDPVMARTVRRVVEALWDPGVGGLRRYEDDPYRGGNPWVLTTLWLGLYAVRAGDGDLARQILDWAVTRRTATGLLPEQVDPRTGGPAWVVPLTWSHAMYVLLALDLYGGREPRPAPVP